MRARLIFPAVLLLLAAVAVPGRASAPSCTTKCTCYSDGCGCQASGGNGGKCDASGDGCYVARCGGTPLQPVGFAADGAVLLAADGGRPPLSAADWERVAPGHAVARGCGGLILAHWYDPGAPSEIRHATRSLTI